MIKKEKDCSLQVKEGYINAKRIVGKEIDILSKVERGSKMKLSEFIKKYGDQKIDESDLKETLNRKAKAWVPASEDRYCCADLTSTDRTCVSSCNCGFSKLVIERSRVFKTEEEAKFEAERQNFLLYMERQFAKNSDPIDWADERQRKWYIFYDTSTPQIMLESCNIFQIQGTLLTTNKYWLREFIEQHKNNIKRYCFGVEK